MSNNLYKQKIGIKQLLHVNLNRMKHILKYRYGFESDSPKVEKKDKIDEI